MITVFHAKSLWCGKLNDTHFQLMSFHLICKFPFYFYVFLFSLKDVFPSNLNCVCWPEQLFVLKFHIMYIYAYVLCCNIYHHWQTLCTTNIKAYFGVLYQVSQSKHKYLKRFPDVLYDNVKVWSNDDDHGTFITFNLICLLVWKLRTIFILDQNNSQYFILTSCNFKTW